MTREKQCCHINEYGDQCRRDAWYDIYHEENGGLHDTYACGEHVGNMLTVPWDGKKHREAWMVVRVGVPVIGSAP